MYMYYLYIHHLLKFEELLRCVEEMFDSVQSVQKLIVAPAQLSRTVFTVHSTQLHTTTVHIHMPCST